MSGGRLDIDPVTGAPRELVARAAEDHARETAPARTIAPHHCHAVGCREIVPPEMLMCRPHWFMVPAAIRKRVLIAYTPGQCKDTRLIKPAWFEHAKAAMAYVLQLELPELVGQLKLPAGYDGAKAKIERIGMAVMKISQEGLPPLMGSLATGEVRPWPTFEAANDGKAEPEGAPA